MGNAEYMGFKRMDWLEDEPDSCKDICSETCESREERVCDKLTGEDHLLKLLHDWGYEDILPPNQYHPVPLSTVAHIITGVIILVAGGAGGTFSFSLLRIHIRFRKTLLDSSGIFLCNFLFSNLLLAVLQCPFSGVSALIGSWIFGDFGCQLYAFVGFQVGIGMILCLLLIIIDVFLFATGSPFLSDNDKRS